MRRAWLSLAGVTGLAGVLALLGATRSEPRRTPALAGAAVTARDAERARPSSAAMVDRGVAQRFAALLRGAAERAPAPVPPGEVQRPGRAEDAEIDSNLAALRAGRAQLERGQAQAAARYRETRRELGAEQFAALESAYQDGLAKAESGDLAAAIQAWEQLLEHGPEPSISPNALLELARAYRRTGDVERAAQSARHVLAQYPSEHSFDGQQQGVRAQVFLAELCAQRGDRACVSQTLSSLETEHAEAVLGTGGSAASYVRALAVAAPR